MVKFGFNWLISSGGEDENVKSVLTQTTRDKKSSLEFSA